MDEELNNKEREELELYRSIVEEVNKGKSWQNKIIHWLTQFCAYGIIVLLMWVSWNHALIKLWPQIPEINPLQMAGLWYLFSVLLKRV